MPLRRSLLLLLAWFVFVPAASAQGWSDDPGIEARVDAVLQQMTLEEKLGQLSQYSGGMPTGPGTGRGSYEEMIAAGQVGSFLNVSGEKANRYQQIAVEQSRLKIPLLFGLDVIHGYRTIFPTPLALSATWDPALVERTARIAAIEARADGIRWTFSPMVDIARDARWGRITEGAGEDPYLGSVMARAYVRGYQGTSLERPDLDAGLPEALCRLWRGRRRARLQHDRDPRAAVARRLPAAVQGRAWMKARRRS